MSLMVNRKASQVNRYTSDGILKRQVKYGKTAGNIYQSIELRANEVFNYSLLMTLIEAQPVESEKMKKEQSEETKR